MEHSSGRAAGLTMSAASTPIRVHEMEAIVCSEPMRKLMAMVERVARGNAAILITGETGTGKELIARAAHYYSSRSAKAWVDVNCAALPEHLVESELFGYEKGAFSGADMPKPGLFELADHGTLFLDEVGDLEPRVQVKLLRVLDGVPYYRVGGRRKISVDVRIVAATNRPLEEAVRTGRFRDDLYHRLGQIQLHVPPLRERRDEIEVLAEYFLKQAHPRMHLSADTRTALRAYRWPGNIRELRNVILRAAAAACEAEEIRSVDLPPELTSGTQETGAELAASDKGGVNSDVVGLDAIEKRAILQALEAVGGRVGIAAEKLGISRKTLQRKLKQYSIESREPTLHQGLGQLGEAEEKYFRASLAVPVKIVTADGQFVVQAVNVNGHGMGLERVSNPFQLAHECKLSFTLPGVEPAIHTQARLVWAEPKGRVGVVFVDLPPDCESRLKAWLREKQKEEGWHLA
jgi:transcriptional regulator with PAS, ATPase and Fis domain